MEEAKKFIKQYQEDHSEVDTDKERTELFMDGLKPAINNLIHMYLPSNITMGQSEAIAFCIYDMIINPEKYLTP